MGPSSHTYVNAVMFPKVAGTDPRRFLPDSESDLGERKQVVAVNALMVQLDSESILSARSSQQANAIQVQEPGSLGAVHSSWRVCQLEGLCARVLWLGAWLFKLSCGDRVVANLKLLFTRCHWQWAGRA